MSIGCQVKAITMCETDANHERANGTAARVLWLPSVAEVVYQKGDWLDAVVSNRQRDSHLAESYQSYHCRNPITLRLTLAPGR